MRIVALLGALGPFLLFAQDMSFTVQLTSGLSTANNQPGDPVTAKVVQPASFTGDIMSGHVTEAKSGNKIHGQAPRTAAMSRTESISTPTATGSSPNLRP